VLYRSRGSSQPPRNCLIHRRPTPHRDCSRVRDRLWEFTKAIHLLWLRERRIVSERAAITVGDWDLCHCLAHPDKRWMEVEPRQAGEPIVVG